MTNGLGYAIVAILVHIRAVMYEIVRASVFVRTNGLAMVHSELF